MACKESRKRKYLWWWHGQMNFSRHNIWTSLHKMWLAHSHSHALLQGPSLWSWLLLKVSALPQNNIASTKSHVYYVCHGGRRVTHELHSSVLIEHQKWSWSIDAGHVAAWHRTRSAFRMRRVAWGLSRFNEGVKSLERMNAENSKGLCFVGAKWIVHAGRVFHPILTYCRALQLFLLPCNNLSSLADVAGVHHDHSTR